ncbi:hypothetical protein B0T25DRAFT_121943 [Lasiosphaeria hispida]|uniref:Uncharacterized protein n=1 Tax=Lasiosphaeria hispida TaxID=260671 RepID=A0AAJ0MIL2_9PEZI|nr:hypothetical protein B0T25DRAFT_121943 [Lasiosphaeria hispida]
MRRRWCLGLLTFHAAAATAPVGVEEVSLTGVWRQGCGRGSILEVMAQRFHRATLQVLAAPHCSPRVSFQSSGLRGLLPPLPSTVNSPSEYARARGIVASQQPGRERETARGPAVGQLLYGAFESGPDPRA